MVEKILSVPGSFFILKGNLCMHDDCNASQQHVQFLYQCSRCSNYLIDQFNIYCEVKIICLIYSYPCSLIFTLLNNHDGFKSR